MAPKEKTIRKAGRDVRVQHTALLTSEGPSVLEISAVCGTTEIKRRVTIGSVSGPHPPVPTKEFLQAVLDEEKEKAAQDAAWKESTRQLVPELE